MDTMPRVMAVVDSAYESAADQGKEKILIIPTSPILLPVDPVVVAGKLPFHKMLVVCVMCDGLADIYRDPSPETIRRVAQELLVLADTDDS